jgi:hypothetical protein
MAITIALSYDAAEYRSGPPAKIGVANALVATAGDAPA